MVAVTIPARLCALSKVIVETPDEALTVETPIPTPNVVNNLSVFSLVILFLRSFVTTLPSGDRTEYDFDALGLSSILSLSSCG